MTSQTSSPSNSTRDHRGQALKRARTAAGLSAMDLAERVNQRTAGSDLTHHAIYSYERGKVLLSREVGTRIAQTLNLHPGELLWGDPDFDRPAAEAPRPAAPAADHDDWDRPAPAAAASPAYPTPVHAAPTPAAPAGLSRELRMQLTKEARTVLPAGNCLYRLLDTAQIARSSVLGYLDLFHLVLRDLQAVLDSPAGRQIKSDEYGEGNDAPRRLVQSCIRLREDTDAALRRLVDDAGSPTTHYDAVSTFKRTLANDLRRIEADIRLTDRGLDPDAEAPGNLLPQLPPDTDGAR